MRNELTVNKDSYYDKQIVSGTVFMVQSLDGNELQYDKLEATLDLSGFAPTMFRPKDADGLMTSEKELFGVRPRIHILVSDPSAYKTGAVVLYKHNGVLVGKYYMASIERVGKTQYKIECVSPVGMLAKSKHYGGIYNGITFPALVSEIIGGVVPFTVSSDLADQLIYGWLPVASRRDNLHQALFAMGAAVLKDESGNLFIGPLYDDKYEEISNGKVYNGGSVKYPNAAAKVSVIEHSFAAFPQDETVVLFDGVVAAEPVTTPKGVVTNGTIVLFDNPMHDLVIENGSIFESGVNYAVLSPSGGCKLSGQKYTHTARETTRPETIAQGDAEDVVSVDNATLVSVVNSENVVKRLYDYYGSAKTVSLPFVVNKERAGTAVQFTDSFGDVTKGIVTAMDINMGNTLKANAEIIADYSPGNAGNFYSNIATITQNGTWVVPSGVYKIRVVLIGGGNGGEAGKAGASGEKGPTYLTALSAVSAGIYHGASGEGGAGGKGGLSGKIYMTTLEVTPGQSFAVTVGNGGAGAPFGGSPGSGAASTLGSLSSASGSSVGAGYAALISGELYALPGSNGVSGGQGQLPRMDNSDDSEYRPKVTFEGNTWQAGDNGKENLAVSDAGGHNLAGGGSGGGAAVGYNGNDGGDGTAGPGGAMGGAGGTGATPIAGKSATIRGSGGNGGHGGGGGGGAGYAVSTVSFAGNGGSGGSGSAGGNGAPGVVLIYY